MGILEVMEESRLSSVLGCSGLVARAPGNSAAFLPQGTAPGELSSYPSSENSWEAEKLFKLTAKESVSLVPDLWTHCPYSVKLTPHRRSDGSPTFPYVCRILQR